MSLSSSPNDQREWHVLSRGERLGPFSRAELRMLLDTHPERWHASVWRPGMFDWRPAANVFALTQGAAKPQPLSNQPGALLVEPPRASVRAPRDADGELRVLSYEERESCVRALGPAVAPATLMPNPVITVTATTPPPAPSLAVSGEWSAVVTGEFRVVGATELRALNAIETDLGASGEWSRVATSEFRVVDTSELRLLAMAEASAPATLHELRALPKEQLLHDAALPSMIVSEPTAMELPSFRLLAERDDAPSLAREAATPTPPALPRRRPVPVPKSRPPLRALSLVLGGLVLLSTLALILIRLR
jgi:hypothetical protein